VKEKARRMTLACAVPHSCIYIAASDPAPLTDAERESIGVIGINVLIGIGAAGLSDGWSARETSQ
jgi:hypothetical protein